jgi:prepilin-type N-terminal cleavage/methylation domain-containing protein
MISGRLGRKEKDRMPAAPGTYPALPRFLSRAAAGKGAVTPVRSRAARRGFTLTEALVAVVIIGVSLIGMVSSWLFMFRSASATDDRAAAYLCARTVMERAKVNGFSLAQPPSVSSPRSGQSRSAWITGNLVPVRYFDANLEELQTNSRTRPVTLYARYRVTTKVDYSPPGTYPQGREDLRIMTVTVQTFFYRDGTELARLQTCMVQGGI